MKRLEAHAALRPARLADIETLLEIKRGLALRPGGRPQTRGGFILGSDADGYRLVLTHGRAWLLTLGGTPVGYATAFPDALLRASPLWARRDQISWSGFDPAAIIDEPIGYLDQLGVLPGLTPRFFGAALGLRTMLDLFRDHRHVLTTTVHGPIRNSAALAYIQRLGGRLIGEIDEVYPGAGAVESGIYLFDREEAMQAIERATRRPSAGVRRLLELGALPP